MFYTNPLGAQRRPQPQTRCPQFSSNNTNRQPCSTEASGRNLMDQRTGETSKCCICKSIYHWAADCPDCDCNQSQCPIRRVPSNQTQYTYMAEEPFDEFPDVHDNFHQIVLFLSNYDHPMQLTGLVAESWNSAVLDCGASKTVCGRKWFNIFV